jgi:hypothetical protein
MKTVLFSILIFLLFAGKCAYSQEINILEKYSPARKGKITLKDGTSSIYKFLIISNSTLTYKDQNGLEKKQQLADVYKITKSSTYLGEGALSGLLIGALACLKVERDYQSELTAGYIEKTDGRMSIYLGCCAVTTAIGGLVGLCIRREKTIYMDLGHTSFLPSVTTDCFNNKFAVLSFKMKF